CYLLREQVPVVIVLTEAANEIGQRAGHEEVFLYKTQALAQAGGVVGIQDARERFSCERFRQGTNEIASAEFLKVEVVVCRRGPEPESIDGLAAVAHHGTIVRNTNQAGRTTCHCPQRPSADLERAVELDFNCLVRTR